MEKKKNNLIIILVGVIFVILVTSWILFTTGTITLSSNKATNDTLDNNIQKNQISDNCTTGYKYSDLKGLYKYESGTLKDESGNEYNAWYSLYLYDNGTYQYRMGTIAPFGNMGNYIIEGDKIILNYLFTTSSGSGINVVNGTKKITINSTSSLSDSVNFPEELPNKNITLTRASENEAQNFLKNNDFQDFLNNNPIFNKTSN